MRPRPASSGTDASRLRTIGGKTENRIEPDGLFLKRNGLQMIVVTIPFIQVAHAAAADVLLNGNDFGRVSERLDDGLVASLPDVVLRIRHHEVGSGKGPAVEVSQRIVVTLLIALRGRRPRRIEEHE